MLRFILIGCVAAVVVGLIAAWQRTASPDDRGWRQVRVGAMHKVGLWLGGGLSLLFVYIRLFVGSDRADAATQMMWLNLLIVGFAALWLGTAWSAITIRAAAVRWRGKRLRFRIGGSVQERGLADVDAVRPTALGRTQIVFDDGAILKIDPYAQGADQLLDRIEKSMTEQIEDQDGCR